VTTPAEVPELLAAVAGIPGVDRVAFDADEAGLLRVDLRTDAEPDAVHAAVDTLLGERFGVPGQPLWTEETTGSFSAAGGRLSVGRCSVDRLVLREEAETTSATVVLSMDGRSAPGSAVQNPRDDGADEKALDGSRVVVSALLLALEELTEDAVIATVEALEFVDGGETVQVRLHLDVDGSEIVSTGSAPVLVHRPQAVARAVLAAVEPHLPT
jgi:hypothetical protein